MRCIANLRLSTATSRQERLSAYRPDFLWNNTTREKSICDEAAISSYSERIALTAPERSVTVPENTVTAAGTSVTVKEKRRDNEEINGCSKEK